MFKCFVCNINYNTADAVLGHIRFFHSNEIAQKRLVCCWDNCVRVFNNVSAYSKPVKSHKSKNSNIQLECTSSHVLHSSNNKGSSNNKSPVDAFNYGKNKNTSDPNIKLCEIDNSNDFHQALTNAVITYVASLYDSFSMSENEIQNVIDCHKTLLGAGFLMI